MTHRLTNIATELDWQLAYLAAQHAETKPVWLTYDTPDGDVTMRVNRRNGITRVEKIT